MPDDRRLARRIQQGDAKAFAEFVDRYGSGVHRLVRRYVENPTDAEDMTQEIFCDLFRSIGGFRGEAALSTWVYRVAANRCLKERQRRRPDLLPYDDQDEAAEADWRCDPASVALKGELADQVQDALGSLSPLHYDVVVLCELHGLTYRECADVLDIPLGTVKSRLFHAFRRLRAQLGAYVLNDEIAPLIPAVTKEAAR